MHLLKLRCWPGSPPARHWRSEVVAFQRNAARRFAPSMRQRIDLTRLWRDAADQLEAGRERGDPPLDLPSICPFTLDSLLTEPWQRLEEAAKDADRV